jgi:hypothetical protein
LNGFFGRTSSNSKGHKRRTKLQKLSETGSATAGWITLDSVSVMSKKIREVAKVGDFAHSRIALNREQSTRTLRVSAITCRTF